MVDSERKFTKSHLACRYNQSARTSCTRFKSRRTDVLRGILNLREQGRDLGHVKRLHVEHGVVSSVIHGVEDNLKIDNFVGRRQLRYHD